MTINQDKMPIQLGACRYNALNPTNSGSKHNDLDRRSFMRGLRACFGAYVSSGIGASLGVGASSIALAKNHVSDHEAMHSQIIADINRLPNKPKRLTCLIPDGSQNNLKPLKSFLQQANIDLRLKITPVDDINTRLLLATGAGGESHDMALPATFGIPDLAAANAIQPLDHFVKRYQPEQFHHDSLYRLGDYFDGRFYGYQTDGDAYLMFYNQAWLDNPEYQKKYEDQFAAPLTIPVTWQQLDQQIAFFHNPKEGRYGGSLFRTPDYVVWEWWSRFHAKGFFPFDDDMAPQIDNDAGIQALEELILAGRYLTPGSRTHGLFDNWHDYGKGQSYCNIGWGGTQKYLNSTESSMQGKLSFSPLPGGIIKGQAVRVPYFNWGWNYTVPHNAENPEAGFLAALLATSPYISTLSVREEGYFDPYRQAHYADAVIQSMYSSNFLEAHQQSMKHSIPDFYLLGRSQYMGTLKTYLHRAVIGEISAKKALEISAKAWRSFNYRYGVDVQAKHWQRIKNNYPNPLKSLLV